MSSDYLYGARAVSSTVFRQGRFLIRVIVPHIKYVLGRAITQDMSKGLILANQSQGGGVALGGALWCYVSAAGKWCRLAV